ncbi:MAG: hypothetical protein ABGX47_12475 [Martelella sp.]|uniref:phage head-tail joining protein n=1 Tax=Martelella sp. TaxID=1969699 RepID=UPI003241F436
MATAEELRERLASLRKLRANGIQTVSYEDETVTYRSDKELASAIADLERQLNERTSARPRIFNIQGRKGYRP